MVEAGRLTGERWPVADGRSADLAILVASDKRGIPGLYAVMLDQPGVQRERLQTIDPTRDYARLRFEDAQAERLGDAPFTSDDLRALRRQASVPLAFEALGGAQACLDMSVEYAKFRYAFGRPIGSFQAVKHAAAQMLVAVESSMSIVCYAAQSAEEGLPERATHAAVAKAQVTRGSAEIADSALTLHGAVGYTWEHDLQLFYKRAKLDRVLFGAPTAWNDRIADSLPLLPASA